MKSDKPTNEEVASAFEALAAAIAGPSPSPALTAQLGRIAENVRKIRENDEASHRWPPPGRVIEGGNWHD